LVTVRQHRIVLRHHAVHGGLHPGKQRLDAAVALGDRGAGRAHVRPLGKLEALALAPDALPQNREIEDLDAHGGREFTRSADARVSRWRTGETPTFGSRAYQLSTGIVKYLQVGSYFAVQCVSC